MPPTAAIGVGVALLARVLERMAHEEPATSAANLEHRTRVITVALDPSLCERPLVSRPSERWPGTGPLPLRGRRVEQSMAASAGVRTDFPMMEKVLLAAPRRGAQRLDVVLDFVAELSLAKAVRTAKGAKLKVSVVAASFELRQRLGEAMSVIASFWSLVD